MNDRLLKMFPASMLTELPTTNQGLNDADERLWFTRLAVAKHQSKQKGAHYLWKRRVEKCRDFIVKSNTTLAASIVNRSIPDPDDSRRTSAESDSMLGLIQAVDGYSLASGYKFSTYAYRAIITTIRLYTIRPSKRLERETSVNPQDGDEFGSVIATLPDTSENQTDVKEIKEFVQAAIKNGVLSEREREVIKLRFFDQLTLEDAGDRIGVTKERVRQIQVDALAKLRTEMEHPGAGGKVIVSIRQQVLSGLDKSGLSTQERAVARLHYLTEPTFSVTDIALQLTILEKTVKRILQSAQRKMRLSA